MLSFVLLPTHVCCARLACIPWPQANAARKLICFLADAVLDDPDDEPPELVDASDDDGDNGPAMLMPIVCSLDLRAEDVTR